ncbi:hypothetical protein [Sorangium sp. So ce1000]|uniref:hypothetical protein n=1 Tax=Sorangium sp. So ce1000 TaxID=3133325 RepID=UPI003F5FA20E
MLRLRFNERLLDLGSPEGGTPERPAAERWIDLAWWWEDRPAGDLVPLRGDPLAARRYVASLGARAELLHELRRFLREDRPWLSVSPGDRDVIDSLAAALAAGKVHVAEAPDQGGATGKEDAQPAPSPAAAAPAERPRAAATPVEAPDDAQDDAQNEPCWPCMQRAAASAQAFRDAAAAGLPFIADSPRAP